MNQFKGYGKNILNAFSEGLGKARSKTRAVLEKEYTPAQKGLILAGVLGIGIVIGFALSILLIKEEAYELEDFEDLDDLEEFDD